MMVLSLRLLLIGPLLWSGFAAGQSSSSGTDSGLPTTQTTLTSQVPGTIAPTTAIVTQSVFTASTETSDSQTPTNNIPGTNILLAFNSSAVLTPLTPTSNTTQYSSSGVSPSSSDISDPQTPTSNVSGINTTPASNSSAVSALLSPTGNLSATQAPSNSSADLTTPLTSSAVHPPLTGNDTTDINNSTDSPQPTATQSTNTSLTPTSQPPIDNTSIPDCSNVRFRKLTYNYTLSQLTLNLENVPPNVTDLQCNGFNATSSSFLNYIFQVDPCKPQNISCKFNECVNSDPILYYANVPPDNQTLNINYTVRNDSIEIHELVTCNLAVSFNCSGENKSVTGEGHQIQPLVPYTNYTCTVKFKYGGEYIYTTKITERTKIGRPENVKYKKCKATNSTITVHWEPPNKLYGPITGYNVTLSDGRQQTFQNKIPHDGPAR
ncbi:uncharacterized protein O3C94_016553 [Discoglossus pictus]